MEQHLTELRFESMGLAAPLLASLAEAGFSRCTPIQAEALPLLLKGQDVAGQAQTGTGKTAAFLLALYQRLLTHPPKPGRRAHQPRALVVAPTRELAVQIHKDAELLGRHTGISRALVYGGENYEQQRDSVAAGVDLLIGTPGRLIDYFKQHVFDLRALEVMVLDEADRMFDMGFIADVRFLMRRMPHPTERLNMLFSATLSYRVMELSYEHMNNAQFVRIEPDQVTVERVRQLLYLPAANEKIALLVGLLRQLEAHRTMVFVNTKRVAEDVEAWLKGNGFKAAVLSGDVPQKKRLRLLREFTEGALPILVTTDVASRGLHIPDVTHVINYDLPQDAEDYVHRIGRTARAGAEGDAISFACEEYAFSLPEIEHYIGRAIPREALKPDLIAELQPAAKRERYHAQLHHHGHAPGHGGMRSSRRRRR
ncbi:MAG: DEAD/DEAH box helicase [Gammaproteobacteria bacterium]|nr:DEAD/DEAH box helicase [Gammaproteobacteria bacterium]MDE1886582.1 DEAD/DEAH box helicase [Gammaproteobacteria bacterium]MDE2024095.1 DEAD/DEAH box helicase [Gammaproteobacteria bacterium]MDE2138995.1 DEAD/DEAH box helicase [Gammaproteobacteria bacterium]MDE2274198.1 DEAD/DEAH box helicase [Gammaproteobacteria bacterium]